MSSKKIMKQLNTNEIKRPSKINTSKNGNQAARINTTINKINQNLYENSKQANLINDQFQDKNKKIAHIPSKNSNKKINQFPKEPKNNHKTQISKKNVRAGIKKQEQFLGGQQKKIIKNNKNDDGCKHFENDVNDNNFNKNILNKNTNNNFLLDGKIKRTNNNPCKIPSSIKVNNNQIDNSNFDNNHIIIQKYKINKQINNSPIKPSIWSTYDKKPPLIVILNCGNTTYISVCIQCFANIRNISSYYIKISSDKIKQNVPVTLSFSNILCNLFPTSVTNYKSSYSLENFYKLIITLNPIFKGKSTKSAIDFLIYFIDKLNDEMAIIIGDNKYNIKQANCQDFNEYLKFLSRTNLNKNIIFQTFSWVNEKVEKCWECNKEQKSFQIYNTYDLDFENALTKTIINYKNEIAICDCIKYTSEEKTIYNVFCKTCNKKNNKNVKSNICLTQNLLIFLFRGLEKKEIRNKLISNKIHIKIEENIDLSQFTKIKIDSFIKYTLHGLILFDTEKLEYLAYCVSPIDSKWYKYNNSSIEQIQPSDLNNFRNFEDYKIYPAILFYRHLK